MLTLLCFNPVFQRLYQYLSTIIDLIISPLRDYIILSLALYVGDFLIAIAIIVFFIWSFHFFTDLTIYVADTQRRKASETRWGHIMIMMFYYWILTIPVYLTLLSLIPLPDNPTPFQLSLIFPMILAFLVSLRLLSNPTKIIYNVILRKDPHPSGILEIIKSNNFKNTIAEFYASIIVTGIFVFIMGFVINPSKFVNNFNILINSGSFGVVIIAYLVALFVLTGFSEMLIELDEAIILKFHHIIRFTRRQP